jgi:hypothetical protein
LAGIHEGSKREILQHPSPRTNPFVVDRHDATSTNSASVDAGSLQSRRRTGLRQGIVGAWNAMNQNVGLRWRDGRSVRVVPDDPSQRTLTPRSR